MNDHKVGEYYHREKLPGITNQLYLQYDHSHSFIACAALHLDKNPDAPHVILVEDGTKRTTPAGVLCSQNQPIAVYVQDEGSTVRAPWRFCGSFSVIGCCKDPVEIKRHEFKSGQDGIVRVIYLKEAAE